MANAEPHSAGRLDALESIRGLAALAVLFSHLVMTFVPEAHAASAPAPLALAIITQSPLRILYDGAFAVRIFFVLSGVVLSISFFRSPRWDPLASAAVRRYFRLTPPIFTTVMISYLLMKCGAYCNGAVAHILEQEQNLWLGTMYAFAPSLTMALKEGTYGVYFYGMDYYIPILWSMRVEFFGSFFVFAFLSLAGRLRQRWMIYLLLGAFLHEYPGYRFHLDFLAGIALCDLYIFGCRSNRKQHLNAFAGTVLLLSGVCIAAIHPGWFDGRTTSQIKLWKNDLETLAAAMIIATVLFCPFWSAVLKCGPLIWLGRISYSLYLIHVPIICSLGCGAFIWLRIDHEWTMQNAALTASIIAIIASLTAASVLTSLVDQPSIALGNCVYQYFKPIAAEAAAAPVSRGEPI